MKRTSYCGNYNNDVCFFFVHSVNAFRYWSKSFTRRIYRPESASELEISNFFLKVWQKPPRIGLKPVRRIVKSTLVICGTTIQPQWCWRLAIFSPNNQHRSCPDTKTFSILTTDQCKTYGNIGSFKNNRMNQSF